jgi:hypothetical protein
MFLQRADTYLPNYMASHPGRQHSSVITMRTSKFTDIIPVVGLTSNSVNAGFLRGYAEATPDRLNMLEAVE